MKAEDYLLVSFEETFKGENDPDYCWAHFNKHCVCQCFMELDWFN
jgi:hypothetical protein